MLKDRRALFLEGSIPRALWTLAVPIIFGNLLQTAYQLTDAFWIGGSARRRWPRSRSVFR